MESLFLSLETVIYCNLSYFSGGHFSRSKIMYNSILPLEIPARPLKVAWSLMDFSLRANNYIFIFKKTECGSLFKSTEYFFFFNLAEQTPHCNLREKANSFWASRFCPVSSRWFPNCFQACSGIFLTVCIVCGCLSGGSCSLNVHSA